MLSEGGKQQLEKSITLTKLTILLLIVLLVLIAISGVQASEETSVSVDRSRGASGGIIIMRHGEAGSNVEGRYNSAPGHPANKVRPLTSLGRKQARQSADELLAKGVVGENICQVLVSPLPRAQETANIVVGKLQIASFRKKTVEGLIENQAGDREERVITDFNDPDPWFAEGPESYGGETYAQVEQRVRNVLEGVINDTGCDLNSQYVLLFSHGVPIYVMLNLLTGTGERISPASFRIIHNPSIMKN